MEPNESQNKDLEWLRKTFADLGGTGALAFVTGVLSLIGMSILVFYAAPGLSLLPIHLIAGLKSIPAKMDETNAELAANRERQNAIAERYRGSNRQLSERDQHAVAELSREELILGNRSRIVQRARDSCIDNLTEDVCGAPCGYIPTRPNLPNPLNMLFLELSPYFPVDYILMVMVILYFFFATTKGIISIGIRFLWINLFKIRRAATQPQGLLAAAMFLMLSLTGICCSLTMSVAPNYSTFGSQKYCNHTSALEQRNCSDYPVLIVPCHIGAPEDLCTPTVTSSFVYNFILATPVLGIVFYFTQWLFMLTFIVSLVFNLIQGCRNGFGVDPVQEDPEDHDDIESRGLLSAIGAMSVDGGRRRAGRRGLLIPGPSYGSIQNNGLGAGPGASPMPNSSGTAHSSPR
ncbi:hypothetical protein BGZ46_008861 [Entomortierella lignicola]|nr:hypothetical protein BGZ46_008861 [Entomortierella lignicola]